MFFNYWHQDNVTRLAWESAVDIYLSSGLGSNGGAGPAWFIGSNPAGPVIQQINVKSLYFSGHGFCWFLGWAMLSAMRKYNKFKQYPPKYIKIHETESPQFFFRKPQNEEPTTINDFTVYQ